MKILVTGGAGFIGSNFILNYIEEHNLLNYDKLNMKKGVLTPASCAGDLLLNRLQKAGIQFSHEIYEV